MKKRICRLLCCAAVAACILSIPASGSGAYRRAQDIPLFAATASEELDESLLGSTQEMGEAHAFRIPALLYTGDTLLAAADRRTSSVDWNDISIALRRSTDGGQNWAPLENLFVPPARQADLDSKTYGSAFYIDALMALTAEGDVVMMMDFFPECKGLGDQDLLEGDLPAYTEIDGTSYLNLYAGSSALDGKAKPGKAYTVREQGWVYTPEGERTNYYLPQQLNDGTEDGGTDAACQLPNAYSTLGDLYYAVGTADYLDCAPPLVPEQPDGQAEGRNDIYAGNVFLSKEKPDYSDTAPAFVEKKLAGPEQEEKGDYDRLVTAAAPLRAAVRCYLMASRSTDGGQTWPQPVDITASVLEEGDSFFLGTAPGVGVTLRHQPEGVKNGRILMPVYTLGKAAVIYSDDHGITWKRAAGYINNVDEWQLVELKDGTLVSFGRQSMYDLTPVSYSTDGGETWSETSYTGLMSVRCQKSVILYPEDAPLPAGLDPKKQYVLASHPSGNEKDIDARDNGRITLGEVQEDHTIRWLYGRAVAPEGQYDHLEENRTFCGYSCLTALEDGTIGLLYEAQPHSYLAYADFNLEWVMGGEPLPPVDTSVTRAAQAAEQKAAKQQNILIGVCCGVAGAVVLAAGVGLVIWRKKRVKK